MEYEIGGTESLDAQIREARNRAELFSRSLQEAREQEAVALQILEQERERWAHSFEEKSVMIEQLERELTSTVEALDIERSTEKLPSAADFKIMTNEEIDQSFHTIMEDVNAHVPSPHMSFERPAVIDSSSSRSPLRAPQVDQRQQYQPYQPQIPQTHAQYHVGDLRASGQTRNVGTSTPKRKLISESDRIAGKSPHSTTSALAGPKQAPTHDDTQIWRDLLWQYQAQLKQAKSDAATAEEQRDQLERKVSGLEKQLHQVTEEKQLFSTACENAEGKLKFRVAQVIECEEDKENLTKRVNELQELNQDLQNQLGSLRHSLTVSQTELRIHSTRNDNLEAKMSGVAPSAAAASAGASAGALNNGAYSNASEQLRVAEAHARDLQKQLSDMHGSYTLQLDEAKKIAVSMQMVLKDTERRGDEYRTRAETAELAAQQYQQERDALLSMMGQQFHHHAQQQHQLPPPPGGSLLKAQYDGTHQFTSTAAAAAAAAAAVSKSQQQQQQPGLPSSAGAQSKATADVSPMSVGGISQLATPQVVHGRYLNYHSLLQEAEPQTTATTDASAATAAGATAGADAVASGIASVVSGVGTTAASSIRQQYQQQTQTQTQSASWMDRSMRNSRGEEVEGHNNADAGDGDADDVDASGVQVLRKRFHDHEEGSLMSSKHSTGRIRSQEMPYNPQSNDNNNVVQIDGHDDVAPIMHFNDSDSESSSYCRQTAAGATSHVLHMEKDEHINNNKNSNDNDNDIDNYSSNPDAFVTGSTQAQQLGSGLRGGESAASKVFASMLTPSSSSSSADPSSTPAAAAAAAAAAATGGGTSRGTAGRRKSAPGLTSSRTAGGTGGSSSSSQNRRRGSVTSNQQRPHPSSVLSNSSSSSVRGGPSSTKHVGAAVSTLTLASEGRSVPVRRHSTTTGAGGGPGRRLSQASPRTAPIARSVTPTTRAATAGGAGGLSRERQPRHSSSSSGTGSRRASTGSAAAVSRLMAPTMATAAKKPPVVVEQPSALPMVGPETDGAEDTVVFLAPPPSSSTANIPTPPMMIIPESYSTSSQEVINSHIPFPPSEAALPLPEPPTSSTDPAAAAVVRSPAVGTTAATAATTATAASGLSTSLENLNRAAADAASDANNNDTNAGVAVMKDGAGLATGADVVRAAAGGAEGAGDGGNVNNIEHVSSTSVLHTTQLPATATEYYKTTGVTGVKVTRKPKRTASPTPTSTATSTARPSLSTSTKRTVPHGSDTRITSNNKGSRSSSGGGGGGVSGVAIVTPTVSKRTPSTRKSHSGTSKRAPSYATPTASARQGNTLLR